MSIIYRHKEAFNDKWVVEKVFNRKKNGFFVDAGAHNGILGSCSYVLEQNFGWNGICIEAGLTYPQLEKNRNCVTVNKALYDDSAEVVEFLDCTNTWVGGVRTELDRCLETYGRNHHTKAKTFARKVQTITLLDLLDENNAPTIIEYLHMDIEGSEIRVLDHFFKNNNDKYTILAMSIEGSECNELLKSHGYVNVKNPFNTNAPWEQYFLHPSIAK